MHTCLCCLYLKVFHRVPGQNTWSDFVYLLGVSRELVSDESSVTGTLDPPVQNCAKHERKQLVSSLISVYPCIFINPGLAVAAKDSRWGLPWRVSAICLAYPPKLKGFGARCSGWVSLRSTDDICSILRFSKEGKGMEFGYQLSEPNAMRKPSDQTQACSGSICWVKQSESGFLYLQKHFL